MLNFELGMGLDAIDGPGLQILQIPDHQTVR
jgi:hypothetical protein